MPLKAKPKTFPGVTALPTSIRALTELLYPQEPELPIVAGLGSIVGSQANKGLKVGYKAAKEKYGPVITALREILQTPSELDPHKVALGSRVTSYYVPHRSIIYVPEYAKNALEFGPPASGLRSNFAARSPQLSERFMQQRAFHDPERIARTRRINRKDAKYSKDR